MATRQLSEEAIRKLAAVVKDWERFGRRLVDSLGSGERTPRIVSVRRNARVKTSIAARSGLLKGKGTVDLLVDDATGTGADKVLQADVTVWNPYRTKIDPNSAGRIVQVETIDGLLQVTGADCP